MVKNLFFKIFYILEESMIHNFPHEEIRKNTENFAEKILKESSDIAYDQEYSESAFHKITIELEISKKALNFLQRENSILKRENEEKEKEILSLKLENSDLKKNMFKKLLN